MIYGIDWDSGTKATFYSLAFEKQIFVNYHYLAEYM